jgi:hypothetical protein
MRRSARIWVGLVAAVAALAFVSVSALAAGSPKDHPRPESPDPSSDPAFVREAARAEQAAERRSERLSSPAAREDRRRSRLAYRGLGRREALAIAREQFPETVVKPTAAGPALAPGERVSAYYDEHRFLVKRSDGAHGTYTESLQPVAAEVGGRLEAIDLSLEAKGADLRPEVSAAPVDLGPTLDDGLELQHSGLKILPAGDPDAERVESADRAFYDNVDTDTDFLAAPKPDGVETFVQLRSVESPEDTAVDFAVPGKATTVAIERDPVGGTMTPTGAHVLADGERAAEIDPPAAWDADGESVPVTFTADGSRLRLHVDHRAGDFHYPILVDPYVHEEYTGLNPSDTNRWWSFVDLKPLTGGNGARLVANVDSQGLQVYGGYSNKYVKDDAAGWSISAHPYTRIVSFAVSGVTAVNGTLNPRACAEQFVWGNGVYQSNIAGPPGGACGTFGPWASQVCPSNCDGSAATEGNLAQIRWHFTAGGANATSKIYLRVPNAVIGYHDYYRPWIDGLGGIPSGWVDSYSGALNVAAHDTGLGVAGITYTFPTTPSSSATKYPDGCYTDSTHGGTSDWRHACLDLNPASPYFAYSTGTWQEGAPQITMRAADWAGNQSDPYPGTIKIDHTPPSQVSAATGTLSQAAIAPHNNWVKDGTYTVNASASDSLSGVKNLELLIDGARQELFPASDDCSAASQCPPSRSNPFTLSTANLAERAYKLKVAARDPLDPQLSRHKAETPEWTVKVDRTKPTIQSATGSLRPVAGTWLGDDTYSVDVDARDAGAALNSGASSIELKVDNAVVDRVSQTCTTDNCPLARTLSASTAQLTDGPHPVEVRAYDEAGNQSDATTWTIQVDRTAPQVTSSGALFDAQEHFLTDPSYPLAAAATDGGAGASAGSGVKSITISVDDREVKYSEQTCPFGGCSMSDSYVYYPSDWEDDDYHVIAVEVFDQAGNRTRSYWYVDEEPEPAPTPIACPATSASALNDLNPITPAQAETQLGQAPEPVVAPSVPTTLTDGDSDETLKPSLSPNSGLGFDITGARVSGEVASQLADGIRIDAGQSRFCLKPVGTDTSTSPARLVNGTAAVYANSRPAVDTVIRPNSLGAEFFEHIRAAAAPTEFQYRIELKPGESLQKLADGSIAVVGQAIEPPDSDPEDAGLSTDEPVPPAGDRSVAAIANAQAQFDNANHDVSVAQNEIPDREVLAVVNAPWARDASGATVATTLDATGNTITLTVKHRDAAYAYPIVADPRFAGKGCWRKATTPYTYDFRQHDPDRHNSPTCRHGINGALDRTRPEDDGNPTKNARRQGKLAVNNNQGGNRKWPLLDSTAPASAIQPPNYPGLVGYVEYVKDNDPNTPTWTLYEPNGTDVVDSTDNKVRFTFYGSGCMLNRNSEGYGVFSISKFPKVDATDHKLRVMMDVDAFPQSDPRRPSQFVGLAEPYQPNGDPYPKAWEGNDPSGGVVRSNHSMAVRFSTGCGRSSGHGGVSTSHAQRPGFGPAEHYVGDSSKCDGRSGDGCGRYRNYQGPPGVQGHADFAKLVDLTISTTGVDSGGVVRAILPAGVEYEEHDRIGYADSNVPCEQEHRVAKWRFGRIVGSQNTMWGWIPTRVSAQNRYYKNPC